MRGLDLGILEKRVVALDVAAEVLDRDSATHVGLDVPVLEVPTQAHAGAVHLERGEQILVQQGLVVSALGICSDQRGAEQHVVHERGVVAPGARRDLARDVLDRGFEQFLQPVEVHAGLRRPDPGHPGGVGQQVVEGRVLARGASELGQHVAHLGGQREAALLDGFHDEDVGEGLCDGEDRENVIVIQRRRAFAVLRAESLGKDCLASAAHGQDRAEIVPSRDIGEDDLAQGVEPLFPDLRHITPLQ